MNLRFYFLLFFSVAFYSNGSAQVVTVSEELAMRTDDGYQLIGKMRNRFLLFRLRGAEDFEVQAYDEKLRLSWKKEIVLDKKNPKIIEIIPQDESFVVIYQYRKKGSSYLKAAKYDPAANLIDSLSFFDLGNLWYTPNFEAVVSEDKSKIVLVNVEKQTEWKLYAFDLKNMKFLWDNKIQPEKTLEAKSSEFTLVDNKANFYYIHEKDNRKFKLDEHRFVVFKAQANSKEIQSSVFPMKDFLTYDLKFVFDNVNNQLIAGGLFSSNSRARANGIFVFHSKNGLKEAQVIKLEFDQDFISGISGRGVDEEKGIEEIDVADLVLRKNGGVILLLERNRILERRSNNGGGGFYGRNGSGYIVDYYYDDIVAMSINPNGDLLWQDIFHKKQYSQDDGAIFSSYFIFKTPSKIRLIFNDDIKNDTNVSEYLIKANGYSDRNAVFSTSSQDLKLRFREALQIASSEFIVPSERRGKFRLVHVIYQ